MCYRELGAYVSNLLLSDLIFISVGYPLPPHTNSFYNLQGRQVAARHEVFSD